MKITHLSDYIESWLNTTLVWANSPNFYIQVSTLLGALLTAWLLAKWLNLKYTNLRPTPKDTEVPYPNKRFTFLPLPNFSKLPKLFFPIISLVFFTFSISWLSSMEQASWLVKVAQGWAMIALIFFIVRDQIHNEFMAFMLKWVGIPLVTLYIFNILSPTIAFFESISFAIGAIQISLYAVLWSGYTISYLDDVIK